MGPPGVPPWAFPVVPAWPHLDWFWAFSHRRLLALERTLRRVDLPLHTFLLSPVVQGRSPPHAVNGRWMRRASFIEYQYIYIYIYPVYCLYVPCIHIYIYMHIYIYYICILYFASDSVYSTYYILYQISYVLSYTLYLISYMLYSSYYILCIFATHSISLTPYGLIGLRAQTMTLSLW
jgi:hypothetical protein